MFVGENTSKGGKDAWLLAIPLETEKMQKRQVFNSCSIFLLLLACYNSPNGKMIFGRWCLSTVKNIEEGKGLSFDNCDYYYVFEETGAFIQNDILGKSKGTWKINEGKIILDYNQGVTNIFYWKVEDNRLNLTSIDNSIQIFCKK